MLNKLNRYIEFVGVAAVFGPFFLMSLATESLLDAVHGRARRQRAATVVDWLKAIGRGWQLGVLFGSAGVVPLLLVLPPDVALANSTFVGLWILLAANVGAFVGFVLSGRYSLEGGAQLEDSRKGPAGTPSP